MRIRSLRLSLPIVSFAVLCAPFVDCPPASRAVAAQQPKDSKENAALRALLRPDLPANASEISAARKAAKVGDTITIRGYIPATKGAFAADAAEFSLVQPAASAPVAPSKDTAPAEPAADSRATIKLVDAKGAPISGGIEGQHGLKAGAEVFVTGKVERLNDKDGISLAGTSLHVPRSPLPQQFFTDKAPTNAKDISEARKAGGFKVGDEVMLRGRIGGSKQPFVAGRTILTLMGRGLKACNENPDDKCSMPWDYCCETKPAITANSVTVQVVDDKGQPLRTDLKGRRGLKELSEVEVVGKVASTDGKGLVVTATSMHVVTP